MQTLIVLNKEGGVENRFPLQNGELLIGRSRGNNVVLPSTSVSRQHARIYTAQGRTFIQDLNSSNGILVNGQRVQETAELGASSEIRIGEFVLLLQPEGAAGAAPGFGAPAGGPPPGFGAPTGPPGFGAPTGPPGFGAPAGPPGPPSPGVSAAAAGPQAHYGTSPPPSRPPSFAPPPPSAPVLSRPTPPEPYGPRGQATPPPSGPHLPPEPAPASPFGGAGAGLRDDERSFARLVGINQPFQGEEWVLSERENTVGRTDDNFVLLPDPSVSRNHARIVRDEAGGYVVYDLRSSNCTAVNRKRITQATLRDGDLISFGNVAFRFVLPRSGTEGGRSEIRRGGSRALLVGLGIFLGVLLLGGIGIGIVLLKDFTEKRAIEERQRQVTEAIAGAKEKIAARSWSEALTDLERALAADPENQDVAKLKEKVDANRQAKETLDQAAKLDGEGKLEEAVAVLEKIPKRSVYAKEVAEMQAELQRKVDARLLEDGLNACSRREFQECQLKLAAYLDNNPNNADATVRLRYAEDRLRRKKIKFERWEPPKKEQP